MEYAVTKFDQTLELPSWSEAIDSELGVRPSFCQTDQVTRNYAGGLAGELVDIIWLHPFTAPNRSPF